VPDWLCAADAWSCISYVWSDACGQLFPPAQRRIASVVHSVPQDVGADRKREWDSERSRHEESFREGNGAANGALPPGEHSPAAGAPAEQEVPGAAELFQQSGSAMAPAAAGVDDMIADGTPP
jgi:hypothetical protein